MAVTLMISLSRFAVPPAKSKRDTNG